MVSNIANRPPGIRPPEDLFRPGQEGSGPAVNSADQQEFEKIMDGETPDRAASSPDTASATQENIETFRTNMFVDTLMNNRIEVEKEQW